jgi:5'-nucleotidase
MRILLSNDDGIDAPGLRILREIAAAISDDVWVVAPEQNKSGAGHSLSLSEPLRMRRVDDRTYAVRGTPTDCVIMGVRHLLADQRPDLILSGVNWGGNLAEDLTYSGTLACAFEGTQVGIRSIAFSQAVGADTRANPHFATARRFGPDVLKTVAQMPLPQGSLLNVNFPDCPPEEVKGVAITRQGRRDQELLGVDQRRDPFGQPYYWLAYSHRRSNPAEGTDLHAIYNGFISVTPVSINLTNDALLAPLKAKFASG